MLFENNFLGPSAKNFANFLSDESFCAYSIFDCFATAAKAMQIGYADEKQVFKRETTKSRAIFLIVKRTLELNSNSMKQLFL